MNNVPYDVGRALINFNISRCVMERVSPGVERERHRNRNERQQLLRLSTATVFILPFDARVARMRARAPIITEVLRLQEVTRRRGRWRLQPISWRCLGLRPMVNSSAILSTDLGPDG